MPIKTQPLSRRERPTDGPNHDLQRLLELADGQDVQLLSIHFHTYLATVLADDGKQQVCWTVNFSGDVSFENGVYGVKARESYIERTNGGRR